MPGMPGRSGGQNRLSVDEHLARGTFRKDRHLKPVPPPAPPVSAADRRRTVAGLSLRARQIALRLLEEFSQWDAASLATLRAYALSCDRLARLEAGSAAPRLAGLGASPAAAKDIHREVRCNLALYKALNLEVPR